MSNQFDQMDVLQLQNAAKAIGWQLDPEARQSKAELAQKLEFQYRWRLEIASIADRAGGLDASEVPEFPYDAERIRACLVQLQPKIRRTQQKKWGWLGVLLLLPIFSAARCAQVNHRLLLLQTEEVRQAFEELKAPLEWSVDTPENPVWSDVLSLQEEINEDQKMAEELVSVCQIVDRLGYSLPQIRPYSYQEFGDYTPWADLVSKKRYAMKPFAFLDMPMTAVGVNDSNIERRFVLEHDLWVMSEPVLDDFWEYWSDAEAFKADEKPILVDWDQAIGFANEMSHYFGLEACYTLDEQNVWHWENDSCEGYRLPTELELIQIQHAEGHGVHANEWAWDMFDPSWLWNMPKTYTNPRINSVNIANPAHVVRSGMASRQKGEGIQAHFRLVREK